MKKHVEKHNERADVSKDLRSQVRWMQSQNSSIEKRLMSLDMLSPDFKKLALKYKSQPDYDCDKLEELVKKQLGQHLFSTECFFQACKVIQSLKNDFENFEWEIIPAIEWLKKPIISNKDGYKTAKSTFTEGQMLDLAWKDSTPVDVATDIVCNLLVAIKNASVVFDLEASPTRIREVGWCFGSDGHAGGDELLADLKCAMDSSKVIVGHNALSWDIEILQKNHIETPAIPVWDTLLVSFLLEPWKASHALGGNHTALGDAKVCRNLFLKQVETIGLEKVFTLLRANYRGDAAAFYRELCNSVPQFKPQNLPQSINKAWTGIAVPDAWMNNFFWRKGVAAGRSTGFLDGDIDELRAVNSPAAIVLSCVLSNAKNAEVILHEDMIPFWLQSDRAVMDFLKRKGNEARDSAGLRAFVFSDLNEKNLQKIQAVLSGQSKLDGIVVLPPTWNTKKQEDKNTLCVKDHFCDAIKAHKCWRITKRVFVEKGIPKSFPGGSSPLHYILKWDTHMLFPETVNVQSYWVETIGRFISACDQAPKGRVRMLFVRSEGRYLKQGENEIGLLDMLEGALCALKYVPDMKLYHSRSRKLKLAASTGKALVAPLEQIHEWLALARDTGVSILAVIESMPLEDWWLRNRGSSSEDAAGENPRDNDISADQQDVDESNDVVIEEDREPVRLRPREPKLYELITRDTSRLAKTYLKQWLMECAGINTDKSVEIWLMDPRLQVDVPERVKDINYKSLPTEQLELVRKHLGDLAPPARAEPPAGIEELSKFTGKNFFPTSKDKFEFFSYQQEPVARILERRPDLALLVRLPTGAGKSLIFQAPALFRGFYTKRLTLVISPLKALMNDQVEGLRDKGFEDVADYLSSDRPWWETVQVMQGLLDNRIHLLYVAPERLRSKSFVDVLERRMECDGGLEYVVFDEAHCISQWGHEFRPDYLYAARKIAKYRKQYEIAEDRKKDGIPILMFSATVPDTSQEAIRNEVGLTADDLILIPEHLSAPIRAEINIYPHPIEGSVLNYKEEDWKLEVRLNEIKKTIDKVKEGSSVIVFVQRRAHAEIVASRLQNTLGSDKVDYFHAGLPAGERHDIYERYKSRELQVLVATKAFGMGMDIPHIHHAVHLSSPTYLEDYLQEVGRIGRDKKIMDDMQIEKLPARLIFSEEDFELSRNMGMKNRFRFEDIEGFWDSIRQHAMFVGESSVLVLPASGISILPEKFQKGSDSSRSTNVRMALHWLEQADRVVIHRMLPSIIDVKINGRAIARTVSDKEAEPDERKVAKALQSLIAGCDVNMKPKKGIVERASVRGKDSVLDVLVNGLSSFVGFIFGSSLTVKHLADKRVSLEAEQLTNSEWQEAVLEMDALGKQTGMSPDDLLVAIWELAQANAVRIETSLIFSCGRLTKAGRKQGGEKLLEWLSSNWQSVLFSFEQNNNELLNWDWMETSFLVTHDEKTRRQWRKCHERALLKLMRLAGGYLERALNDEGDQIWKIRFSKPTDRVTQRCENIVILAENIWKSIGNEVVSALSQGKLKVRLSTLMGCADKPRRRDLEQALDILGILGLVHTKETLLPMAYFLELKQPDAPLEQEPIKAEIDQINDMAELRGWAMESFCYISSQSREQFIEGYFTQGSPDKLRKFLMNFLNEESKQEWVNDKARDSLIRLRNCIDPEYVRQQFEDEVFGKHRAYEEQWQAITMPKDKHVLVNAGPGSGKTAVLIARIVHLIQDQHVHPHEIMVLAFNRAVVHEIRTRIRDIFDKVGYGGYVRSLRVSTFHGLAAQHVDRSNPIEAKKLLSIFAGQLIPAKAAEIAGGIKSILVDEFQDMNEELWGILTAIQKVGNAHIFAIGDDDQDILSWNRKKGPRSSTEFFKRFSEQFELESLALTKNFRSSPEIVERSQKMIERCSKKIGFTRRKEGKSLTAERSDTGAVSRVDARKLNSDDVVSRLKSEIETSDQQDIAILCRTNAEVAWWHEKLQGHFKDTCKVIVQGSENYDVGRLRHVACWLDCVDGMLQKKDGNKRLEDVVWRDLSEKWQTLTIPEAISSIDHTDPSLKMLWYFCRDENPYAKLSDLKEFVSGLKLDEYEFLLRRQESVRKEHGGKKRIVLSTTHKVKGLEFDHVIIAPSWAQFPYLPKSNIQINQYAQEEARLYYVAMTRAKNRLTFFFGSREQAWLQKKNAKCVGNQQNRSAYLKGSLDDFEISWAARKSNNGDNNQSLIENEIKIGEKVKLNGSQIKRKELCIIGELRKKPKDGNPPPKPGQLEVVAIIRYDQTDENYRNSWCKKVQERKPPWSWLVCVKGFYEHR